MKFYKDKIKELFKKDNIVLRRFAKSIGVSHTSVSAWLKGTREPREHNVVLMAKAFGISVSDISDMDDIHDISSEVSGYFQGWGASLNKNKIQLEDPCIRAIKEIENIKSEQYRLRTVTRAFMSTMHSMLYVKNFHGEYIVANESYIRAIGLDVNINLIGKVDKDIMSQKVAAENNTQDLAVINTGKSIINKAIKFPFQHSSIKWCVITKVPLKDNKLNIVGMVASITDVTMERMLRKQDEMLKEVIKHINASVIVISVDIKGETIKRNFVYANEATKEVLGCNSDDLKKNIYCWYENIKESDKFKMVELMSDFRDPQRTASCEYKDPVTGKNKFLTLKCLKAKGSNLVYNFTYEETEMVHKENEIKKFAKQEAILNEAIKQSNAAIAIISVHNTDVVYINDAALDILGYGRDDLNQNPACWYKNICETSKAEFAEYLNCVTQEKRSVVFDYLHPVTGVEKNIELISSSVKNSDLMCHCVYDNTEKKKQSLEREKLNAGFKLLGNFINKSDSIVFVGEYINNTMDLVEYVYRNQKSYSYFDEGEKWENTIVPEQCDEVLKLSAIKKYPKTIIYNVLKKDGKVCTVEEKTWLQVVNSKTYFLSIITDIEKQNNVKIAYPKTLDL